MPLAIACAVEDLRGIVRDARGMRVAPRSLVDSTRERSPMNNEKKMPQNPKPGAKPEMDQKKPQRDRGIGEEHAGAKPERSKNPDARSSLALPENV